MNDDKLSINRKQYSVNNLEDLPKELNPAKISTQTVGEVTIFFTRDSPLSNHYMGAPFEVLGKKFSCTEQCYFYTKAMEYGDEYIAKEIMKQSDPAEMMRLGRRATNHNKTKWNDREVQVMKQANQAKYDQNEGVRKVLLATGTTKLGEASSGSKSGKFWGTGFSLTHKDRLNTNKWYTNKMGDILSEIRDTLPKPMEGHE